MKIDLDNKIVRFLVQEYVNKICYYVSEDELSYNLHKLIHTFNVVDMAKILVQKTKPTLPKKLTQQIINAAVLHDLGRCHEFKKGKRLKDIDHGKIGAQLIKKHFPEMKVEIQSTLFHNKLPSDKDPKFCKVVLDYVRDADMLANILYEIEHIDTWLLHILGRNAQKALTPIIDEEIFRSVKEYRPANHKKIKTCNLLTLWLWQLCWCFNLSTDAGRKFAIQNKLFTHFREIICKKIVPMTTPNKQIQNKLCQEICNTFPDKLFLNSLKSVPVKSNLCD